MLGKVIRLFTLLAIYGLEKVTLLMVNKKTILIEAL